MEKDRVLLDLEKYNELRDFKKEVEESLKESRFAVIEDRRNAIGFTYHTRKYYTESEAILDFETRNKELEAKIEELEAQIEKAVIKEPVQISINDLKKMSYWEFRKWRKS